MSKLVLDYVFNKKQLKNQQMNGYTNYAIYI